MEMVVTTGAKSHGKLQSNHQQRTNIILFTGRMPFLSPSRQCQSTEGKVIEWSIDWKLYVYALSLFQWQHAWRHGSTVTGVHQKLQLDQVCSWPVQALQSQPCHSRSLTRGMNWTCIVKLSLSLRLNGHFSRCTWVSRYQNVSILDLLELRMTEVVVTEL